MDIILIRHGKPTTANNPRVNAAGFTQWVRQYNFSDVSDNSRPALIDECVAADFLITSDLKRAIHSAYLYTGRKPDSVDEVFREMDIPRYKIPLKLNAWTWVYLNRVLWMLGVKGSFETFSQAKNRADIAAEKLINMAKIEGRVVLFGHGYLNLFIRKALVKKGWGVHCKSNQFWGVTRLQA
jgi:broad specificity phosphatase PhoE